jgi:ribosomal protein S8
MRLYGSSFFTNHLKISISSRNFFFDIRYITQIKPMLQLLKRLNIVSRFIFLSNKIIRVFPNWVGDRSTLKKIRFFQKKTPLSLTLKSLIILNTHTFNSYIILSTSKGLLTHKEALRLKTGGTLLCVIL